MDCPNCGLVNPDSAGRCDCGYDFSLKKMQKPFTVANASAVASAASSGPKRAARVKWRRGLAAGTVLVACTAAAAAMWLRENPYFFMVNALHAGMSSKDVREALGEPCPDYGSMLFYRKSGAAAMLLVLFDIGPPFGEPVRNMPNWFILDGPLQDGYTKYKVRKYRFFGPPSFGGEEGVLEFHWSFGESRSVAPGITSSTRAPELVALSTNIFKVDINGNPYPCFSRMPW